MDIMDLVPLILGGAVCGWGLYQLVRCLKGTKVTAYLTGYEETDYQDTDPSTSGTRYAPVYSYTYKGFKRTYRSNVLMGLLSTMLPGRDSKTLYLDDEGNVYEMSAAVCFLALGVAAIVLGETLL